MYVRPHGMRIDPDGNIWTTDVNGHTVTKMNAKGDVLMTLGTKGQTGKWDEATHLMQEPADIAFGPNGDVFVVEGHGRGEGRVLRFDKTGKLLTSWGGTETPGQFDQPHSILVNNGQVLVGDRENRRVQIFDLERQVHQEWKFAGLPCGLYRAADGPSDLASGFAGQILQARRKRQSVAMMGQPGKGLGEFGEAHYMTMRRTATSTSPTPSTRRSTSTSRSSELSARLVSSRPGTSLIPICVISSSRSI